jgi:uncharacterized protein (TIGR02231 family)
MKPRFALKFILCLSFGCLARISLASEVVDTRIDAVTVYADGAKITRTGTVQLNAGLNSLLLEKIPSSADPSTFRVNAAGTGKASLMGINHIEVRHEKALNDRIAELDAQIRGLERITIPGLDDRLAVMQETKEFLLRLAKGGTDDANREFNDGRIDVTDWETAFSFISKRMTTVTDSIRVLMRAREDNVEKLSLMQNEKSRISSTITEFSRTVQVDVQVETAGVFSFSLEYIIPGATWSPLYDAHLDREKGEVEFNYFAEVRQSTGEDWNDVNLTLSTARPASLAMLPDFKPWYLAAVRHAYGRMPLSVEGQEPGKVIKVTAERETMHRYEVSSRMNVTKDFIKAMPVTSVDQLLQASAQIINSGIDVFYTAARKETVPSGNKIIRTPITVATFKGSTTLICRPHNSTDVYRSMNLKNSSDAIIMPGQVNVFDGPNFIGKTELLQMVVPGQEFELPFGPDNMVALKKEMLVNKQNMRGSTIQSERTFKLAFKNHSREVKSVLLEEAFPISQDNRIKVKIEQADPEPEKIDERGKASWTLTLQPGEERILMISYSISRPTILDVTVL